MLGNHEDALIAVAAGSMRRQSWYGIGGAWAETLADEQLSALAACLSVLPLVRIVGDGRSASTFCTPSSSAPTPISKSPNFPGDVRNTLLWGRGLALGSADPARQRGLSLTYCGHTPMRDVKQIGSQVFIDTGAFSSDGRLTIVEPGTDRRWSVKERWAAQEGARELALP